MVFIYILKLIEDKYYVGKTENPEFRINEHFKHCGSVWTTKYKPLELVELIPNCDQYDEDKYTIKYMQQYGIDNVRGGTFCQLILEQSEINIINKMFIGSSDKCYRCHQSGHFIKDCKELNTYVIIDDHFATTTDVPVETSDKKGFFEKLSIIASKVLTDLTTDDTNKNTFKTVNKCTRCKRYGHLRSGCYANTSLKGNKLKKKN